MRKVSRLNSTSVKITLLTVDKLTATKPSFKLLTAKQRGTKRHDNKIS